MRPTKERSDHENEDAEGESRAQGWRLRPESQQEPVEVTSVMPRWFDVFTDCLCIMTASVLAGIALDSAFGSLVATVSTMGILYWWRGQQ